MEDAWAQAASRLLRVEMMKRGWSYEQLLRALEDAGVMNESERNLRNKVARGTFSAAFLVQTMIAMGAEVIPLDPTIFADAIGRPPGRKQD